MKNIEKVFDIESKNFPQEEMGALKLIGIVRKFLLSYDENMLIPLLKPYEINVGEYDILTALCTSAQNEAISPSGLKDHLFRSAAGISQRLTSLENRGLISRQISKFDKRHIRLEITEKGRNLMDIIREKHYNNLSRLYSVLDNDERENIEKSFYKLLDKCIEFN